MKRANFRTFQVRNTLEKKRGKNLSRLGQRDENVSFREGRGRLLAAVPHGIFFLFGYFRNCCLLSFLETEYFLLLFWFFFYFTTKTGCWCCGPSAAPIRTSSVSFLWGKKKSLKWIQLKWPWTWIFLFFFLRIRRGWASAPVQRLLRQRRLICIGRLCVLCRSYFGHFYFALFFTPQPSAVSTFMAFSLYRCVDSTVWMAFIEIVLNFWNRRQLF